MAVDPLLVEIFGCAFLSVEDHVDERGLIEDDVALCPKSVMDLLEVLQDVFPSFVHVDGSCDDGLQKRLLCYIREKKLTSLLGDCDSVGELNSSHDGKCVFSDIMDDVIV